MTLLELILAMALSGIILVIIGMAIDLNLRVLDNRRSDVERVQLARAVLQHIAADLHNAVLYQPIDLSGAQDAASTADLGSLAGGGDLPIDTGGMDTGDVDLSSMLGDFGLEEEESPITENNADIAGTAEPTSVPGLYGNQYELQIDVSHLPRVDQYEQAMLASPDAPLTDIPSDVKSVAYFVRTPDQGTATDMTATDAAAGTELDAAAAAGTGLVRRGLDRAVTSYASQDGSLDTSAALGEVIAPEVNYIEFRYFDGTEWRTEWDSEQLGGLPVAIEVTIGLDPAYGLTDSSETVDVSAVREASLADMTENMFRLVVRLPTAQPLPLDEMLLDTETLGTTTP